jgi:FkbM family methyltransferase
MVSLEWRDNVMSLLRKVILKFQNEGAGGLATAIRHKILGAPEPVDENLLIAKLLPTTSSGVMIDVGACHGAALKPFAQRGWRVFAFEPDPANRNVLTNNVKAFPGVDISPEAITETDGQVLTFYSSDESVGISSLTAFTAGHKPTAEVTTTRLDTFIKSRSITKIDYLKIDAEGHDLFVLRSFPFEQVQPSIVMCEFEDRKTLPLGYTMTDMADLLQSQGYLVIVSEWAPIKRYGIAHQWKSFKQYPVTLDDKEGWGNLIAIHDSAMKARATEVFGL